MGVVPIAVGGGLLVFGNEKPWRAARICRSRCTVLRQNVARAISKAHGEPMAGRDLRVLGAGSRREHTRDATMTDSAAW